MATRGYNSYRGRTSGRKKLLIAALIVLLLAAAAFLFCQNHVVYDGDGHTHVELPWSKKDPAEQKPENTISPEDVKITREEPVHPTIAELHATELSYDCLTQDTFDLKGKDAVVVNVKRYDGTVAYDTAVKLPDGVDKGDASTLTNLKKLLGKDIYTVARISCLADTAYAHAKMEDAGLLRDNLGDTWYDIHGECWLDPTKDGTLDYATALCKECTELGFDEIMLDYFSYPTTGDIARIFYGEDTDKTDALMNLAQHLRDALPKSTPLAIVVHENLAENGGDTGITAKLLQVFDRIYIDADTVDADALQAALPTDYVVDGRIVPMVHQAAEKGSYLVLFQ